MMLGIFGGGEAIGWDSGLYLVVIFLDVGCYVRARLVRWLWEEATPCRERRELWGGGKGFILDDVFSFFKGQHGVPHTCKYLQPCPRETTISPKHLLSRSLSPACKAASR